MRLFISYARDDKTLVQERIVKLLELGQHVVWFDDRLGPGEHLKHGLSKEIQKSDVFVYAITPESLKSDWCKWELQQARAFKKKIVSVILKDVPQIPEFLSQYNYLDFSKGFTESEVARLVGGVQLPLNSKRPLMLVFLLILLVVVGAVGAGLLFYYFTQTPLNTNDFHISRVYTQAGDIGEDLFLELCGRSSGPLTFAIRNETVERNWGAHGSQLSGCQPYKAVDHMSGLDTWYFVEVYLPDNGDLYGGSARCLTAITEPFICASTSVQQPTGGFVPTILTPDSTPTSTNTSIPHPTSTPTATSPAISSATAITLPVVVFVNEGNLNSQQTQGYWALSNNFIGNEAEYFDTEIAASFLQFEHGYMLWRGDLGTIWVLFDNGVFQSFSNDFIDSLPEPRIVEEAPSGFTLPTGGFATLWHNYEGLRELLGWSIGTEFYYIAQWWVSERDRDLFIVWLPEGPVVESSLQDRFIFDKSVLLTPIPLIPLGDG